MQTQPFEVKLPPSLMLSANINLKVMFKINEIKDGLFIPRTALLSNEEETAFWVMKMVNNKTAVKEPVTIGWQGKNLVQVLSGKLSSTDRIITEGAYGLPDKASVQITNK